MLREAPYPIERGSLRAMTVSRLRIMSTSATDRAARSRMIHDRQYRDLKLARWNWELKPLIVFPAHSDRCGEKVWIPLVSNPLARSLPGFTEGLPISLDDTAADVFGARKIRLRQRQIVISSSYIRVSAGGRSSASPPTCFLQSDRVLSSFAASLSAGRAKIDMAKLA